MEYKKALIVDDSRAARLSLRKTLEKLHIQVDCVESGENALSYLNSSAGALPDIIFMDNLMPGMNGFSTSKAINEQPNWSHIPILMCSATEGPDSWPKAQQHGISAILSKPASVEDVSLCIQRLFHIPIEQVLISKTIDSPKAINQKLTGLHDSELKTIEKSQNRDVTDEQHRLLFQRQLALLSQQAIDQFQQTISHATPPGLPAELLNELKNKASEIIEERILQITSRLQKEINNQLHQLHHHSDEKKLQNQQFLEQVKSTAQFVATHHSIETAERIAKETAHQLLQGELASMTKASKSQRETQIQTKFMQLQKRLTSGLYINLTLSIMAMLFSLLVYLS